MENSNIAQAWQAFVKNINPSEVFTKLISVGITLLIMFVLIRVTKVVVHRIFTLRKKTNFVSTAQDEKRNKTMATITCSIVNFVIVIVGVLTILSYFIDIRALLTVAGVGTVAVGFGAKRIVEDVISGFFIIFQEQYFVGDYVEIQDGHYGVVERIDTMMTSIRQTNGSLFMIRNGEISHLVNHSRGLVNHSVDILIDPKACVSDALDVVNKTTDDVYGMPDHLFPQKPVVSGVAAMDERSITLRVSVYAEVAHHLKAEAVMREKLIENLTAAGIPLAKERVVVENINDIQNTIETGESHA